MTRPGRVRCLRAGELVEDQGFLDMVYDLLGDSNPMVVSNAVAALAEISETSELGQKVFQINTSTLQKMLAALNECTEWGQVLLLAPHKSTHEDGGGGEKGGNDARSSSSTRSRSTAPRTGARPSRSSSA